jgi:hypothetical protein
VREGAAPVLAPHWWRIHSGPVTLLQALPAGVVSDVILGRGVGFSAEILVQDLTEDRLAGSGVQE